MTNVLKICLTLCERSGIHEFPLSKQDQLIEQGDDIAAWLMNGKNHSAIVVSRQSDEAFYDVECII